MSSMLSLVKTERTECVLVLHRESLAAYNAWVDNVADGFDYNENGLHVLIAVMREVHPNSCKLFTDSQIRESILAHYEKEQGDETVG